MAVIGLVDALRARSLCCDCLVRVTGLNPVDVRSALLRASPAFRFNTWTPCQCCGAADETYRITGQAPGSVQPGVLGWHTRGREMR